MRRRIASNLAKHKVLYLATARLVRTVQTVRHQGDLDARLCSYYDIATQQSMVTRAQRQGHFDMSYDRAARLQPTIVFPCFSGYDHVERCRFSTEWMGYSMFRLPHAPVFVLAEVRASPSLSLFVFQRLVQSF